MSTRKNSPGTANAWPLMTPFEKRIWSFALVAFALAGLTGFYFRGIMHLGWETRLLLPNIRHAHSHLMYFAWATPVLMLLIVRGCPNAAEEVIRRSQRLIGMALALGLLSYVPFVRDGYAFALIGGLRLPLSITVSTSSLLVWYAFAWNYRHLRKGMSSGLARPFFDSALAFLALSSLGAWGLGAAMAIEPANPVWMQLALHLFMDVFALGWLLMSVLGLVLREWGGLRCESVQLARVRVAWKLLVFGTPATFLLGVHPDQIPPMVRFVGSAGALLVAAGLLLTVLTIGRQAPRTWRLPLILVVLQAVGLGALAVPNVAVWGFATGLRIPYLHLVLLGIVTPSIVAAIGGMWGARQIRGWPVLYAGSIVLLLTLLPTTGLWPESLRGAWTWWVVAGGSLAPVAGAIALLALSRSHAPA